MRFVIHHHTGRPGEEDHYDLMIEEGASLATWRVGTGAMGRLLSGEAAGATKIADHRREYLSYEGPISCDRGMVRIMDTGECEAVHIAAAEREYRFHGNTLKGTLTVSLKHGDRWEIKYSNE